MLHAHPVTAGTRDTGIQRVSEGGVIAKGHIPDACKEKDDKRNRKDVVEDPAGASRKERLL